MIVIMKHGATAAQIANVTARVEQSGCQAHLSEGSEHTIIGVVGNGRPIDRTQIEVMPGVDRTVPILRPFKLASRQFHPENTIVPINGIKVGGEQVIVMAGPCSVESHEQVMETAKGVKAAGAQMLRGGAFKPRTSPYSFQGLGEEGLRILADARIVRKQKLAECGRAHKGLSLVTEIVTGPKAIGLYFAYGTLQ